MKKNTVELEFQGINKFTSLGKAINLKSFNVVDSLKGLSTHTKTQDIMHGSKLNGAATPGNRTLLQLQESILECKRERDGVDSILKLITIIYFVVVSASALVGIAVLM